MLTGIRHHFPARKKCRCVGKLSPLRVFKYICGREWGKKLGTWETQRQGSDTYRVVIGVTRNVSDGLIVVETSIRRERERERYLVHCKWSEWTEWFRTVGGSGENLYYYFYYTDDRDFGSRDSVGIFPSDPEVGLSQSAILIKGGSWFLYFRYT